MGSRAALGTLSQPLYLHCCPADSLRRSPCACPDDLKTFFGLNLQFYSAIVDSRSLIKWADDGRGWEMESLQSEDGQNFIKVRYVLCPIPSVTEDSLSFFPRIGRHHVTDHILSSRWPSSYASMRRLWPTACSFPCIGGKLRLTPLPQVCQA